MEFISVLKKIKIILTKKQKRNLVILLFLIIVGSLFELLSVSALLPLINIVLDDSALYINPIFVYIGDLLAIESTKDFILVISAGLIVLYLVKNVYLVFYQNTKLRYEYNLNQNISMRLMKHYMSQDYLFHAQHNVAELQRNVSKDTVKFVNTVSTALNIIVEITTCSLMIAFLLITDWATTMLIVVIMLSMLGIYWKISKSLQFKYGNEERIAYVNLNKWLLQSFGGIKEIKVLNREQYFLKQYDKAYKRHIIANRKYNLISLLPKYITETLMIVSVLLAINIRMQQGTEVSKLITAMSAFVVAAIKLLPSFNRFTNCMSLLMFNKSGADKVYNDMRGIRDKENADSWLAQKEPVKLSLDNEIYVKDIHFSYPNSDRLILDRASLKIKANSSVAFIGASGAGKTTLADLIIGLLEPQQGNIYVDGIDVNGHLEEWHKSIGYIPQTIYLLDGSIRDNVVFGLEDAKVADGKVWDALEKAQLADYVRTLPDGLDTQVGDRGVRLSGGQRQRIGIARALYNEPSVLILDEATAALDNETEAAVMDSINYLHGKTTLIIIAHRLSTIENCDEVYEIADGKVTKK